MHRCQSWAKILRRIAVTYWFIINEISAVICCEDPTSSIRHSEEWGEMEKCSMRLETRWSGVGWGLILQSEQNATNEQTAWTKMKLTEKLGSIKVIRTRIKE